MPWNHGEPRVRRVSGLTAGLWCASLAWLVGVAAAADPRPNVVLCIADDVSWDDLGCYGNAAAGDVPPFLVDDAATRADLASYRNEVTRFDHFVGAVVAELERQNVLDDTLLIVMADNGRPFPRAKTRLHDSGMKTPFVVHWPRGIRDPGTPTTGLVSAIDIAPTVLAVAGVEPPATMQGVSFLPLLADPAARVRHVAFSEHNWHDYEAHGRADVLPVS